MTEPDPTLWIELHTPKRPSLACGIWRTVRFWKWHGYKRVTIPIEWWITDGPLDGVGGRPVGRKILGPFFCQNLAIKVRAYVEKVEGHERFWVCPEEWNLKVEAD